MFAPDPARDAPGVGDQSPRREVADPRPGARRSFPAIALPGMEAARARGAYGPRSVAVPPAAARDLATVPVTIYGEPWSAAEATCGPRGEVRAYSLFGPRGERLRVGERSEGGLDLAGLRGLACTCPEGSLGRACPHAAALVRLGMLRVAPAPPDAPPDPWPEWADEPLHPSDFVLELTPTAGGA
ncbi:MAG TPA: hypothetical protein VG406_03650 [Isosphaeraceae bacterium]|jgi:hypothetical protein|nr:hypothetical protein [Isosphaeraceae bacterium]